MSFQPPSGPPPSSAPPQAPTSPSDQPAFPFVDPSLRRSQDQAPQSFLAPAGPPPGGPGFVVPRSSNRSPSPARQGPPAAPATPTGGAIIQDTIGSFEGCFYKIDHRDSNSLLSVTLQQGYSLKGKSGSMVAMAGTVQIQGKMKLSFKKFMTGGDMTESIFTGPGEVMLAPEIWGDIVPIRMDGQTEWNLSKDAFLAATPGVVRTSKSQGFSKGLFSGEGFFVAKASGVGMMFIQSLGAIVQKQLQPGEQWIVDNGHLVAWTAKYQIERIAAGGFFSGSHTGEGLVCRFTGPGTVYIQTRNPESLVGWIAAQMPAQY